MSAYLQLRAPECERAHVPAGYSQAAAPPAIKSEEKLSCAGSKVLRFAKSERILHWSIAGPFLVSFASGVALALIYNPDPSRPWRVIFAALHRVSGVALTLLPMLALVKGRHDVRIHLYNITQAWTWMYDDFRWLALMGLAAISSRFRLPEQGKFNAAEKLNFMVLMSTYPLYLITGLLMWLTPLPVLSWIMHCLMAMIATPLLLGHLYMALINAGTRPALEGMISGHVDRQWAKHHYSRWYRKHHESSEEQLSGNGLDGFDPPAAVCTPQTLASIPGLPAGGKSNLVLPATFHAEESAGDSLILTNAIAFDNLLVNRTTFDLIPLPGWRGRLEHKKHLSIVGIQPKPAGGRLSYELTPGRFVRLCTEFRKTQDEPAFMNETHTAKNRRGFTGPINLLEVWNQPSLLAHGGILQNTEDVHHLVTVNAGDCVLASPPRIICPNPGAFESWRRISCSFDRRCARIGSLSESTHPHPRWLV